MAPNIRVEIEGQADFLRACDGIVKDGKRTLGQLLLEGATMTHKFAVESIQAGGRSGRVYFKTKEGVAHVAAAPGEPPKTDTGQLVENITLEKEGSGYTVGSRKGAPHGFWQELGTSRMSAHPWLGPAFERMMNAIRGKYG